MIIAEIVKKYLEGMTLRQFADALGVKSHATIINWRSGKTEPEFGLLVRLVDLSDWRGDFAKEVLKIKYPSMGG